MAKAKIVMLIAHGPNDLQIPCRWFPDMNTAVAKCSSNPCLTKEHHPDTVKYFARKGEPLPEVPANTYYLTKEMEDFYEGNYDRLEHGLEKDSDGDWIGPNKTEYHPFIGAYFGCGGFNTLTLVEVEEDTAFIYWDLD